MRPALTGKQRKHRLATSKAMKAHAEAMKCRMCGRNNALKKLTLDLWTTIHKCRYCGHECERRTPDTDTTGQRMNNLEEVWKGLTSAFEEGRKAYAEGKPRDENPYISGKTKRGAPIYGEKGEKWLAGWHCDYRRSSTEKEIEEANRLTDCSQFGSRRKRRRWRS